MKKMFNISFTISTLFIIVILTLRFNIVESFIKNFVKNKISNYLISEIRESISNLDETTKELIINGLVESNEFVEINSIFYETLIKDLNDETTSEINISNELNSLINANLIKIPEYYKKIVEDIIKIVDFNKIYNNVLSGIRAEISNDIIKVLRIYNSVTNDSVIALLGTIIIFSLIIILLKNKSFICAINDIGMSLLIDGGIMMILLFFLRKVEVILSMIDNVGVDLSLYTYLTFAFIIIGFILKNLKTKKRS